MKSEQSDILLIALFLLAIFSFSGWYLAQQDNDLLRQELEAQKLTQSIHAYSRNGDKQHD